MKNNDPERVLLDHGSGGRLSRELFSRLMRAEFSNPLLDAEDDAAILDDLPPGRVAFTTDSFVVDPLFFPGGSIADLAVNGTVNDLAMVGARVLYLSVGLVIEEGLPMADLARVVRELAAAARVAGAVIATGDTKVVPRGAADRLFINTSGIGVVPPGVSPTGSGARPGDALILSGTLADHGMAVLAAREGLDSAGGIRSDTAPLNGLVAAILAACPEVRALRDPTRGGVATAVNEIAEKSGVAVELLEERLPMRPPVAGLCELLGFDPLYVANEGKLLAFVPPDRAEAVLAVMRAHPLGREAAIIGRARPGPARVTLCTRIGGQRVVDMLVGDQLPRIC
ncbi:MAG: hydrogenase expression/formation protein HypE [Proteobacteria bacterium]|nr:hydrogenase expression/formation protein HypE [Pseudomonadota bacterium]